MNNLPDEIISGAFRSKNGELAWRRPALPDVFKKLADCGCAILGGEVWAVRNGQVWGAIPPEDGGPSGVWHWEIERMPNESWAGFCQRAANESIRETAAMRVEDVARKDFRDHIYFNVTWISERDV